MRAIWTKYSDEFGYRSEKLAMVDAVDRFEDSYHLMQMLDYSNRCLLRGLMFELNIPMPDEWADVF